MGLPTNAFLQCQPAIGLGSIKCGGLSELDLSPTVSTELDSIYYDEAGLGRIHGALLESDWMGNACQIRKNSFYDYIMATARSWDQTKLTIRKIKQDLIEIEPFVLMERKGPINNNYWNMSSGTAATGTSPSLSASYTYTMVVTSEGGIPADLRWFPPLSEIFVSGKSSAGLATRTNYRVVDATISGQNITLYLISRNAGSMVAAGKREAPVTGVVSLLVPNINPYQSYCYQNPSLNTTQLVPFWVQDTRWTLCIDEHTEKYLQLLRENNKEFAKFGDVESVEFNRQVVQDFQRRFVNTALFNPVGDANQTMALWKNLPTVGVDGTTGMSSYFNLPGITGRQLARQATSPGWYQQLSECNRVKDLQNLPLNLEELFEELKTMMWLREDLGIPSDTIELVTDSTFARKLNQAFFRSLNQEFEGNMRVVYDPAKYEKKAPNGMFYNEWKLQFPAGLTVRVVTHRAFDDFFAAHNALSIGGSGRMVLALDFGRTVYVSILESTTVNNSTGDLATLSALNQKMLCTMKVNKQSVQLKGMKFACVVECPGVSLWMENIADAIPEHRGVGNNDSIPLAGAQDPQARSVIFNPGLGDFTGTVSVYMSSDELGVYEIRYTTNGTTPTGASTLYSGSPITLSATTTVKAIVVKTGYRNSDVASKVYTKIA